MAELEVRAAAMAWDWSGDNIAEDEDDRRAWVPVTPMTLPTRVTEHPVTSAKVEVATQLTKERIIHDEQPIRTEMDEVMDHPTTPGRKMAVYTIEADRSGNVAQAKTPTVM